MKWTKGRKMRKTGRITVKGHRGESEIRTSREEDIFAYFFAMPFLSLPGMGKWRAPAS